MPYFIYFKQYLSKMKDRVPDMVATPDMPTVLRLTKEDGKFKASLDYMVSICLKKKKKEERKEKRKKVKIKRGGEKRKEGRKGRGKRKRERKRETIEQNKIQELKY
jgi:hypothetical protein